jgi:hypothetical chaperone protein
MRRVEFAPSGAVGLDFGTTNSAIAAIVDSRPVLAEFTSGTGTTNTFPSVLYFDRRKEGALTRLVSAAGPRALQQYLDAEDKGRLIQSLKAYLADRNFDGTGVFSQHYSLVDLVSLIVRHLLLDASSLTPPASGGSGPVPSRVVAGRPVHFSNARKAEDDEFALRRLRAAISLSGFRDIVFEYEPVAAAYSYEQTLDRDELILIGAGGGARGTASSGPTASPWQATRSTGRSSASWSRPAWVWGRISSHRRINSCRFRAGHTSASSGGTTSRFSIRRRISRCSNTSAEAR